MKKFITVAGALLLGSVVSHQLTEEQIINGLENLVQTAEKDVSLIRGHLESIKQKKRARSVDSVPQVEAGTLTRSYGSRNLGGRTSTTPSLHPIEIANMGSQIVSGLGNTAATMYNQIMQGQAAQTQQQYYQQQMALQQQQQQPQVEGFLGGLGEVVGLAGDLTGLGYGIYQMTQPQVEAPLFRSSSRSRPSSMHPLQKLSLGTEALTGLAGTGASMYGAIMQGKASQAEQQYYQSQMQPQVQGFGFGGLLRGIEEGVSLGGDITSIASQFYPPQVESLRSTRRPSSMHPLEKLSLGTQALTGLAGTGASMYGAIMQGQASQTEQQYYQQLANQQPQVESAQEYLDLLKGGAQIAGDLATTGANIYKIIMETKPAPKVESYEDRYENDWQNVQSYQDRYEYWPSVELVAEGCPPGAYC